MLKTRILAALIFTPIVLGLVYLGGYALGLACIAIAMVMLWEFLELTLGKGEYYEKALGFVLGLIVAGSTLEWLPALGLGTIWPASTVLLLVAQLLQPLPIEGAMQRTAFVSFGIAYCAGLIPYLAKLRELEQGLALAFMALLCTWAGDTGAYFAGRFLGKRKLYPAISPSKTVEGLVGGIVAAMAAAYGFWAVFGLRFHFGHALAMGALAGSLGVLGDLAESMLKRSVGAKDSSSLIPGHGGVLDRFDAVMVVAPAIYVYCFIFLGLR